MYGICFVYSPRGARRERRGYGLDDTEDGASRLKHLRLDPSDRSAPLGVFNYINKKERVPTGATGITSTYVENTMKYLLALTIQWDHLHIRGEHLLHSSAQWFR